jgi:methylated-DNA-[protein]-cysteine S-methyltransferase
MLAGRGYTVFDTTVGRCGIAWSQIGIVGVHLPEAREIETRRRMLRQYPEARELRPPPEVEIAIDGIVALLRGQAGDFTDVTSICMAWRRSIAGSTSSRAPFRAARP